MCLAVPALITEILPDNMAKVSLDGVSMTISTMLVKSAAVGDYVIVHVGYALSKIDPDQAKKTLDLLDEARNAPVSGAPASAVAR